MNINSLFKKISLFVLLLSNVSFAMEQKNISTLLSSLGENAFHAKRMLLNAKDVFNLDLRNSESEPNDDKRSEFDCFTLNNAQTFFYHLNELFLALNPHFRKKSTTPHVDAFRQALKKLNIDELQIFGDPNDEAIIEVIKKYPECNMLQNYSTSFIALSSIAIDQYVDDVDENILKVKVKKERELYLRDIEDYQSQKEIVKANMEQAFIMKIILADPSRSQKYTDELKIKMKSDIEQIEFGEKLFSYKEDPEKRYNQNVGRLEDNFLIYKDYKTQIITDVQKLHESFSNLYDLIEKTNENIENCPLELINKALIEFDQLLLLYAPHAAQIIKFRNLTY